jgi:hypothetical protein
MSGREIVMRNAIVAVVALVAVWGTAQAQAPDENTPEGQAKIKTGEVGKLEQDSISEYGSTKRFEVRVVWDDPGRARPAGHLSRKVRYVADCKAGTLIVAAVALYDASGMLVKSMLTPPGAADPMKPEPGSTEARWLQEVCRE